jgi:hypothetical protein
MKKHEYLENRLNGVENSMNKIMNFPFIFDYLLKFLEQFIIYNFSLIK